MSIDFTSVETEDLDWEEIRAENLDLDYVALLPAALADQLFAVLEQEVEYFTGALARVHVYAKWCQIPRQQAAYGDPGRTYKFSGLTVPAMPWPDALAQVRDLLLKVTGYAFNFVLVNRYRDGSDYISEHRDDEADLDRTAPIASLSLGESRDFVLRHADARKPGPKRRHIEKVSVELKNGCLLMMKQPTNKFWYHSLPQRKRSQGVRINLTFRKLV